MKISKETYDYKIDHLIGYDNQKLLNTLQRLIIMGFLTPQEVLQKMISDGFSEEQIREFKANQNLN